MAESACLQWISSASDWSNSTCQPFLTSNWHFWQMVQMSAQCLLYKTEKAQISGQMQIICTGWQPCVIGLVQMTYFHHFFQTIAGVLVKLFEKVKSQIHLKYRKLVTNVNWQRSLHRFSIMQRIYNTLEYQFPEKIRDTFAKDTNSILNWHGIKSLVMHLISFLTLFRVGGA